MTRARDTADTQDNLGGAVPPFAAGKNKIINGDFNINQRGFTTTTTTGTYGFDRWVNGLSGGTATYSAETFTPGTAPVVGYESTNFARLATTVGNDFCSIRQSIEDVRTFAGQTVTLSFWAKGTNPSTLGGLYPTFTQAFGSGGSGSVIIESSIKVVLTANWTRYSITFNIPSISGKTIGSNSGLILTLGQGTNTSTDAWTLDIWGVQLEAGSVATPFQTASGSLGGELALCQRYYQKSYAQATAPGALTSSGANVGKTASNTVANLEQYGTSYLKVSMRAAPSVTIYGRSGGTGVVSNPVSGADLAANSASVAFVGQNSFMIFNDSGGTVTTERFSVMYHYVASAEL